MFQYKVDFNALEWEVPFQGIRHKYVEIGDLRFRLVEYSKEMPPHWCERGHHGYLIDGRMEIEYENGTVAYNPGDGIVIPDGPEHKHKGRVLSEKALVYFMERASG